MGVTVTFITLVVFGYMKPSLTSFIFLHYAILVSAAVRSFLSRRLIWTDPRLLVYFGARCTHRTIFDVISPLMGLPLWKRAMPDSFGA